MTTNPTEEFKKSGKECCPTPVLENVGWDVWPDEEKKTVFEEHQYECMNCNRFVGHVVSLSQPDEWVVGGKIDEKSLNKNLANCI